MVERLVDLVHADLAGYFEYGDGGSLYSVCNYCSGADFDSDAVKELLPWWPLHDARWAGKTERAVTFGELLTPAQRRKNPWYVEVMRGGPVEHEVKVWLPAPPGVIRGFFATRGADVSDFGERDRTILGVLRPHLAAIRDRWDRRTSPAGLTAREVEVVRLLREGLTNGEIADRLVVATSTVRTHLENVFEKLGVHTRTAAVARAFDPNT